MWHPHLPGSFSLRALLQVQLVSSVLTPATHAALLDARAELSSGLKVQTVEFDISSMSNWGRESSARARALITKASRGICQVNTVAAS